MDKKRKFSKFQTSKLSKSKIGAVKGGCTNGTRSVCHIDGTIDADSMK